MATSAFRSTSRRGAAADPPPAAASRRRSHSVSAVSRKTHVPFDDNSPIPTEFSNSRDNPLFWAASSSPTKKEEGGRNSIVGSGSERQSARNPRNGNESGGNAFRALRGRSVTRSVGEKNGIGRSLSRVRGRSVSRADSSNGAYESEKEPDLVTTSTIAQSRYEMQKVGNGMNRTNSVRNRADKRGHAKPTGATPIHDQATEWSEDDSACSFQISNMEDGISLGSLSEAEDRAIKAACEESKAFRRKNVKTIAATNVAYMPSDLVNPEPVEYISDIRREYAIKLEESEERARKLRADLHSEEQRGQELNRILKEILPDSNTSVVQRSRRGRKTSNERKRMSKCLTEEALAYFDECVSLSTFDSSDFSASEDPTYTSVGASVPVGASSPVKGGRNIFCYDQGSGPHHKQVFDGHMQIHNCEDSGLTANSSTFFDPAGISQHYQFSFAARNAKPQEYTIRSYIKNFERDTNKEVDFVLESTRSYYDAGEYVIQGHIESVLIDRVVYSSTIGSGGLLLCGGAFSSPPFASVV